jgi:tryptophan synthase beta subunit
MGAFFGVLAIIQGIVFIVLANEQRQIKKSTNIMIGLAFIGVGIAMIG